jgi:pimeloyl-ACP methyl ester carboxylesterase
MLRTVAQLIRDGVALGYEERGAGDPPLLLVHGILCDRRYLAPQLTHFAKHHRTVAVDLRGHGESDAPEQEYTITGFADDLRWMSEQLRLNRPVVIGHSLGGIIALAMGADDATVRAIVAMDSVLISPPERAAVMRGVLDQLRTGDHVAVVRDYFGRFFGPADDADRREWILDQIGHVPKHVAISAWENGFFGFDSAAAGAACHVPFLYIDAGTPNVNLPELARLCPTLMIARTVGAGHFHELEVPDQINAIIDRFLAISAR